MSLVAPTAEQYPLGTQSTGFPASGKIRESQGEIYFSGQSGKVREFVPFLRIQGKSGNYFLSLLNGQGKSGNFVLIQVKHCVLFYVFLSKYAYRESNFVIFFSPQFSICPTLHSVISLHRMNKLQGALMAFELACINIKLLHLHVNNFPEVRESQGKFALKSQGKSGIFVRA